MRINRSRFETFMECQRRYHYTYNLNIIKPKRSEALRTGSFFHRFLEKWYDPEWMDRPMNERHDYAMEFALNDLRLDTIGRQLTDLETQYEAQVEERCKNLCTAYTKHYGAHEEYTVLMPEVVCEVPIGDGHTLKVQTDAIVSWRDKIWLEEHKTTGRFGDSFIEKFMFNHQLVLYCYAVSVHLKKPVAGIIVNAIRKPQQRAMDQTPEFYRQSIVVTPDQIKNAIRSIHRIIRDIESRDPTDAFDWAQDTLRCHDYGKCSYWEICALGAPTTVGEIYVTRTPDYVDKDDASTPPRPIA